MKIKKFKKNKGVLIWLTGLSGSGKSSIAKKIYYKVNNIFGPTIILNGDNLRKILHLYKYDEKSRFENAVKFSKLCRLITGQNISIIFAAVGMKNNIRKMFKSSVNNYVEIFIDAKIKNIKKKNLKKTYKKFKSNIVGKDIKAEFPKNPDIKVKNDLNRSINNISKEICNKIEKISFKFS